MKHDDHQRCQELDGGKVKAYFHREKLWDDILGYDESRIGHLLSLHRWAEDGTLARIEMGYYDFHKHYREIEPQELVQYLTMRDIAEKVMIKAAVGTAAQTVHEMYQPCTRTTPRTVLVNSAEDVWPILEQGDIAALPLHLVGGNIPSWHAWAHNSHCRYWSDDGNLYLQENHQPNHRNLT